MLFNSYGFILGFLPLTVVGYFLLCRGALAPYSQLWLMLASLLFYSVWNPVYLPLLLGSIAFNFAVSRGILARQAAWPAAKRVLVAGIAGNLLLLGYFKYTDFFLDNVNAALGSHLPLLHIVLPLGISFFTFTQIAFLVDTWNGRASRPGIVNYALFVSYFPHVLAGPILHHREMMPQFEDAENRRLRYDNVSRGLFLFTLGFAKKVLLADSLAEVADGGFSRPDQWALLDAWVVALAYTLQLYFDFSGYTDMALGMSRMFNIRLPINFNTPYRATSIQDFWHRWHMTLSRFLRDYLYVPLGGNRGGRLATARNVMITFLLGGLWHGAGWTFVVWGALHGGAMVVQRAWSGFARPLPAWLAWLLTFLFVNVAWVFFRAPTLNGAFELLQGMAGWRGVTAPQASPFELLLLAGGLLLAVCGPNSNAVADSRPPTFRNAAFAGLLLAAGLLSLRETSPFIYFNF
jgi:D-alanyl-lipoteichoic acid acyltransferase DltB (MBOAT superfamily)